MLIECVARTSQYVLAEILWRRKRRGVFKYAVTSNYFVENGRFF